jgi:hypothetical protein
MRAHAFRHLGQAASIDARTLTASLARLLALFHAFSGIYPSLSTSHRFSARFQYRHLFQHFARL